MKNIKGLLLPDEYCMEDWLDDAYMFCIRFCDCTADIVWSCYEPASSFGNTMIDYLTSQLKS